MHVIDFRGDLYFRVAGNSNDFAQSFSEEHPMTTRKFLFVAEAFATVLAMQNSAQAYKDASRRHAQRRDLE